MEHFHHELSVVVVLFVVELLFELVQVLLGVGVGGDGVQLGHEQFHFFRFDFQA